MICARLEEFRQVAYEYLGRAKDATFELTDAILLKSNVYSLGWTPGKTRLRKNRFPTVKKTATPPRKEPSVAV